MFGVYLNSVEMFHQYRKIATADLNNVLHIYVRTCRAVSVILLWIWFAKTGKFADNHNLMLSVELSLCCGLDG